MAELTLTPEQIKSKLETDKVFGIQFIVENQPNIVVDKLKADGKATIDTPSKAYEYLKSLIEIDPEKVKQLLNGIPYDAAAPNWTGTMDDYFPTVQTKSGGTFWSGLLAGIGAIATATSGALGSTTTTTLTPAQIEEARLTEVKRQEELKKAQQRQYLVIGIISLILIILAVLFYNFSQSKKAAAPAGA
jgi:hypothetical protein